MKIECCQLFDGMPYLAEKDGKYHVLQGSICQCGKERIGK